MEDKDCFGKACHVDSSVLALGWKASPVIEESKFSFRQM